jgi:hypothetical protein
MDDKDLLPENNGPWNHIIQELRRRLDDLTNSGHHTNREIKDLQNCMHDLAAKQKGQFTPEQVIALSVLLLLKERKAWLFSRLKVYVGTSVAVIAGIFVFRTWIADIFFFLAKIFKSG